MLEEYQGLINEISNTQQLLKNELKSALDDPPNPPYYWTLDKKSLLAYILR